MLNNNDKWNRRHQKSILQPKSMFQSWSEIHKVDSADEIRYFLQGSEISDLPPISVQDPYAFRCIPQVHGASKAAFDHVNEAFTTELNSVTDNPTIFADSIFIVFL